MSHYTLAVGPCGHRANLWRAAFEVPSGEAADTQPPSPAKPKALLCHGACVCPCCMWQSLFLLSFKIKKEKSNSKENLVDQAAEVAS